MRSFSSTRWISRPGSAARTAGRELGDDADGRGVRDRVHRVDAQAVEVELGEPVERVVDVEVAHRAAALRIEIDRRPPGRDMRRIEERRRVGVQVVAFRAEVVVDDVEQHHQAARVRGVDEALHVVRRAVGRFGREQQHAVVAPAARAGEVGHRHQLDGRDAERDEVIETLDRGRERSFRREGAHVELVHHRLVPRPAAPLAVLPLVRATDRPRRWAHARRRDSQRDAGSGTSAPPSMRKA